MLHRHMPNALTILRLLMAVGFFVAMSGFRYPDQGTTWGNFALGLFVAASLTDLLDGYLARRWNAITTFGRIMDPLFDKVLVLGGFILLAGPGFEVLHRVEEGALLTMVTGVHPWMVVVMISRELLVMGVRGTAEYLGISFGAQWTGKVKMVVQCVCVSVVLFLVVNLDPDQHAWIQLLCHGFVWITLLVTVWSSIPYFSDIRRIVAGESPGQEQGEAP